MNEFIFSINKTKKYIGKILSLVEPKKKKINVNLLETRRAPDYSIN